MDSVCRHQEQVLVVLASGSTRRTADWLAFVTGTPPKVVRATEASADWGSVFLGRRTYLPGSFVARWSALVSHRRVKVGLALPDPISTRNKTARHERRRKRMLEVERADAVVNAAFSRVRGIDRYSRSAPIGRAELATIVLQGLAELGALADWTVSPGVTESVLRLLDDDERMKYREF
jgi:hypothetical protein